MLVFGQWPSVEIAFRPCSLLCSFNRSSATFAACLVSPLFPLSQSCRLFPSFPVPFLTVLLRYVKQLEKAVSDVPATKVSSASLHRYSPKCLSLSLLGFSRSDFARCSPAFVAAFPEGNEKRGRRSLLWNPICTHCQRGVCDFPAVGT